MKGPQNSKRSASIIGQVSDMYMAFMLSPSNQNNSMQHDFDFFEKVPELVFPQQIPTDEIENGENIAAKNEENPASESFQRFQQTLDQINKERQKQIVYFQKIQSLVMSKKLQSFLKNKCHYKRKKQIEYNVSY